MLICVQLLTCCTGQWIMSGKSIIVPILLSSLLCLGLPNGFFQRVQSHLVCVSFLSWYICLATRWKLIYVAISLILYCLNRMDIPFTFKIVTHLPIAGTVSNSPESFLDVLQSAKDELREKSKLLVVFKEELETLKTEKQHVSWIYYNF